MSLSVEATGSLVQLRLVCFPEDVAEGLNVLLALIQAPAYTDNDVALAKQHAEAAVLLPDGGDQWRAVLLRAVTERMFAGLPAGRSREQIRRGLENINKGVIDELHKRLLLSGNVIVTLSGDYDRDATPQMVVDRLADLQLEPGLQQQPAAVPWPEDLATGVEHLRWDHQEAGMAFVVRAPGHDSWRADGAAFAVSMALLVGADGQGGYVREELDKIGMAGIRGPYLYRETASARGFVTLLMQADPGELERVQAAIEAARQQLLTTLRAETIPDEVIALGRAASESARLLQDESRGLTLFDDVVALLFRNLDAWDNQTFLRQVAAVDAADLAATAERYLSTEPLVVTLTQQQDDLAVEIVPQPSETSEEPLPIEPEPAQ